MHEEKPLGRVVTLTVLLSVMAATMGIVLLLASGREGDDLALRTADPAAPASAHEVSDVSGPPAPTEAAPRSKPAPRTPESKAPAAAPSGGASPALHGRVLDDAGTPIAGAVVSVGLEGRRRPVRQDTDAEGRYRIDGLEAGTWYVRAGAPGRIRTEAEAVEVAGPTEKDFTLLPGATVRGRVTEAGGSAPIFGATVVAMSRSGRADAETAPDGSFTLSGLGDGEWSLWVGHDDYLRADQATQSSFAVQGGAASPADFSLELTPGARIEGRVFDLAGNPVAGAFVFGFKDREQADTARTDAEGVYRLAGLPEGAYELFARSEDYGALARQGPIDLAPGDQFPGADLVLEPGATIEGLARADGTPVVDLQIVVLGIDGQVRRGDQTDEGGRFEVGNLYPGRYRVEAARGDGGSFAPIETVVQVTHLGERIQLDLDLSSGAVVEGTVVGPVGALPQAGVYLLQGGEYVRRTGTDEEGRFRLDGLAAGVYDLYLRADGEDEGSRLVHHERLDLADLERREGERFQLAPPAHATGVLLGPDGRARPGVQIEVESKTPGQVHRPVVTGDDGTFRVDILYDGEYVVHVGETREVASFEIHAGQPLEGLRVRTGG